MSETETLLSAADIAALLKQDGENVLVLMVGVQGSGKSTLARALEARTPFVRISADEIRKQVTGSEADHDHEGITWGKFLHRFRKAMRAGEAILIDNMNHTRSSRRPLLKAAREAGYRVKLVFLRTPLAVCIARNRARPDKGVDDFRIMRCHMQLERSGQPIEGEWALMLAPTDKPNAYRVLPAKREAATGFDVIGDVHGCIDELLELTDTLGYKYRRSTGKIISTTGRRLVLVGDLNDRGPDSAACIEFAMNLVKQGVGEVTDSNHGRALRRALRGDKMRIDPYLQDVIDQIDARGPEFRKAVLEFMSNRPLVFQAMVDGRELVVVHAAYSEKASQDELARIAIYGQTTGKRDERGFPERLNAWETAYMGGGSVVHGHTYFREPSVREVSYGGAIVNVDTGCVFGGKLTALRYPEMEFVSVPARKTYVEHEPNAYTPDLDERGEKVIPLIVPKTPVIWSGQFGLGKGLPTLDRFAEMQADGWITSQAMRTKAGLTYRIFNYTNAATFNRVWNEVTLVARGLIICEETGECIAASLPKFFNLGERIGDARATLKDGPFETLVKLDGACGIGYRLDDAVRWSTRGSFHSDGAAYAQQMWDSRYGHNDALLCGELNHLTPIAEIIHRKTRVVCPYDFDDLVLVAMRNRFTGDDLPYEQLADLGRRLGMRVTERVEAKDAREVIEWAKTLDGRYEGYVLNQGGHRVKVKGLEYSRLHRILSDYTPAELCRRWYEGSLGRALREMPEEFREETEAMATTLDAGTIALVTDIENAYTHGCQRSSRREYAEWVKTQPAPLPKFLYPWRQREEPEYSGTLARHALSRLILLGQLEDLLSDPRHSKAAAALASYAGAMTTYLWDNTRGIELINQLKAVGRSMPKTVRGPLDGVIVSLQPALIAQKMRAFVERSQHLPELVGIDCTEVFLVAPPTDAPRHHHTSWVFAYPPALRTFLDRWRICGQRETATIGAYKLLADAVRSGDHGEYLTIVGRAIRAQQGMWSFNGEDLSQALTEITTELEALWNLLPHGSGPQALCDAVNDLGGRSAWGTALLQEAWSSMRAHVRDGYLASEPQLDSFSKLEEG